MAKTNIRGTQIADATVDLAADITGTLPVGNGGTGAATLPANNVLIGNGTGAVQAVAPGALGEVLSSTGSAWQSSNIGSTTNDLKEDWTNNSDGVAPATTESGHSLVSTYSPSSSAALAISGGMLTTLYTGAATVVGYETALVKNTSTPVLYIEFDYKFLTTGGTTETTQLVAGIWESAWTEGTLGAVTNRAPVHFLIGATTWTLQTYDSAAGNAQIIGTAYNFNSNDGVVRTVRIALDPTNNRAVVLCPDGKTRVFYDSARTLFAVSGFYAQQEVIRNTGSTDKPAGFTRWRASAIFGEYDSELQSRYYSLLQQGNLIEDRGHLIQQTANFTLTSQTAAQRAFNGSAAGQVTVPAGTYGFEALISLASMSATSGSFGFALNPGASGGATIAGIIWRSVAVKAATLATAAAPSVTLNTGQANTTVVTASTATAGFMHIVGKVRVSAVGTLVPRVSLGVAAAAVVQAESFFRIWRTAEYNSTTVGTEWT